MANFKQVVGVLGENLASFLELSTKFLVTWKLDPKKLLHMLQNLRKDDVNGLIAGTHEIKLKVSSQATSSADTEDFECMYTSELITVPDMKSVITDCKKLWGDKMGGAPVPEGLKTGIQKRVKIIRLKKNNSSQKIVDYLKQYPGAILPNVFGLRIAEITCLSHLPKDTWIRGIDERDSLSVDAIGNRVVPLAYFGSDGTVNRDWSNWVGDWFAGSDFLVLCD